MHEAFSQWECTKELSLNQYVAVYLSLVLLYICNDCIKILGDHPLFLRNYESVNFEAAPIYIATRHAGRGEFIASK